jgi:Fe-S cluster biogenesis protein NfuA
MGESGRLPDAEVGRLLDELDELLARLEQTPGPTAELALDAVSALTAVYGEALARVADAAAGGPVLAALARDELVRHLLMLHEVHPDPVEVRVERALDEVRPYLRSHGGDVQMVGIEGGVARLRLSGHCDGCRSSTATLESAVRAAVLGAAPELSGVEALPATAAAHDAPTAPAVIPVEALLRRPLGTGATR